MISDLKKLVGHSVTHNAGNRAETVSGRRAERFEQTVTFSDEKFDE